jgi:F-type H+-transporting ATPase subunit delta
MSEIKVGKRYAKSLIGLAAERGALDIVHADMKFFLKIIDENRNLELLLGNPIVHSYKKQGILQQIFFDKINKITQSFLDIVVRKGREKYLVPIAKEFIEQYKILKGIQTAEIISASGLDDKLRKQVYDIVRNSTKSEVELIEKVDQKLIGGFVLRIGDKQYDASILSSLRKLQQAFAYNPYVKKN